MEDIEREWDEAEEPREVREEDEQPVEPYTPREQERIMGDVQHALRTAEDHGDVARVYYIKEVL